MNILILIAAVISGMAAIIGAWYGVRSYRELSRPYRIKLSLIGSGRLMTTTMEGRGSGRGEVFF